MPRPYHYQAFRRVGAGHARPRVRFRLARRSNGYCLDMSAGIPWHVRFRGWFLWRFWPARWRSFWVRYWESQGISEEQQMLWAAEAEEEERVAKQNVGSS